MSEPTKRKLRELVHVDGGTHERGIIRDLDRDQIKRDAENCLSSRRDWLSAGTESSDPYAETFARHCLALLTELEQSERATNAADQIAAAALTRLAKTPALVEAAKRAAAKMKREYDRAVDRETPPEECWAECEHLWHEIARWEADQP